MTATIRRLAPGEGTVFRDIRLTAMRIAGDSFGGSLTEDLAKPAEWFEQRIAADGVFIADLDGRVVGLVGLSQRTNLKETHKGVVYSTFVHPDARGHGVGAALMEAALAYGETVVEIVQLVVVSTNTAAVSLYERAGFEPYGLEPFALKVAGGYTTDLHMWKRLR